MIKILAALFMLIDHIGMIFFPENYLLRIIGRVSMPLFAYCIARGFYFSEQKGTTGRYARNLFLLPLFPKYRLRFFLFGLRANLPLISALHGYCLYAL